jgi:hypothetical protein
MIVRISTEGQYVLGDEQKAQLEQLDNEVIHACEASDEQTFRRAFDRLLDFVRTEGRGMGQDELVGSDLILPPPDVSLQEAREEFSGEGLIPG